MHKLSLLAVPAATVSRLKDEFLASLSHEPRTPLNAVLGRAEALQDEILGLLNGNQKYSLQITTKPQR